MHFSLMSFSWLDIPFHFNNEWYFIICMFYCLSIHLLKDIIGYFQVLAINKFCYKYLCTGFCVSIHFQLIWVNTKEHNCWLIYFKSMFCLIRNCQTVFWSSLYYFAVLSTVNESFYCSTNFPEFGVMSVLDFGLSNSCVVVFVVLIPWWHVTWAILLNGYFLCV